MSHIDGETRAPEVGALVGTIVVGASVGVAVGVAVGTAVGALVGIALQVILISDFALQMGCHMGIKPDVTAPGFFISSANSNADGDCPITEMAGTSMATPITAGNVALIRQYLREGFYPTGERGKDLGGNNFDGGMIPSGALMKAMTRPV